MRSWPGIVIGIAAVIVLVAVISCVYTIYPTDQVLLTRLGAVEPTPAVGFAIWIDQLASLGSVS